MNDRLCYRVVAQEKSGVFAQLDSIEEARDRIREDAGALQLVLCDLREYYAGERDWMMRKVGGCIVEKWDDEAGRTLYWIWEVKKET